MMKLMVMTIIAEFTFCSVLFSQGKENKFIYDAKGKRDPFMPLVTDQGVLVSFGSEEELQDIHLEGIIYDAKGISYAIINGNVVKIGDSLGNVRVLKIEEKRVFILKNEKILSIELEGEEK